MSTDPNDRIDAFLTNAISAAREAAADGADDGAGTRLRVRESLTQRPPRHRFTLIAAIVGTMLGSTAFAYVGAVKAGWVDAPSFLQSDDSDEARPTTSMELPEVRTRQRVALEAPPDDAPAPTPTIIDPPIEVAPPPVVVAEPPPIESRPPPPVPEKIVVRTPRRVRPAIEATPSPVPEPTQESSPEPSTEPTPEPARPEPPPAVAVKPDAELSSYRAAHDLHFKSKDMKAALLAWDAYLVANPNGKLAQDARWNRALVLVKLGRFKDARSALQPFANQNAGAYRQKEALELLAALKDR